YHLPALLQAIRTGTNGAEHLGAQEVRLTINHRPRQVFQLPSKDEEEHHWHMHQAIREIGNLEPIVSGEARSAEPA
ncbi:MAG: hypothetical protein AAFX85_20255, partial [Pseudomonadota bacterium]